MRGMLLEKLPPLATLLPGGPRTEKEWERHVSAWEMALKDLDEDEIGLAFDRWARDGERYPTPSQIRAVVTGELRSNQRFRFAYDNITGEHRGNAETLNAADRHNIAARLAQTPCMSHPYRAPMLELIKLLDESVWMICVESWPDLPPRPDEGRLAEFRQKILCGYKYNPLKDF